MSQHGLVGSGSLVYEAPSDSAAGKHTVTDCAVVVEDPPDDSLLAGRQPEYIMDYLFRGPDVTEALVEGCQADEMFLRVS